MTITTSRPARPIALVATGIALAGLLIGCGDDDTTDPAAAEPSTGQSGPAGAFGAGAGPGMPGTSGQIAAVSGDVLQVRSQMSGQVAVTVSDTTTITDQAAAKLADVGNGVCVVVRSADQGSGDEGSDAQPTRPSEVTAASVSISAPGAEGCAGGFGGGPGGGGRGGVGGERPSGMPTARPTDLPSDLPTTRPGGGRPGGLGVVGEVTSVTDNGFVVTGTDGDVTVAVGDDTTYTQQVEATASALEVGRCVRVDGDADDAGAVSATSIQVSDAVDDQCGR